MSCCIVLAVDQKYVRQACVTIASYALSNPVDRFEIYVLVWQINQEGIALLQKTGAAFGMQLHIVNVDMQWTDKLPESFRAGMKHVSPMTYSKFIAMEYIPQHFLRCLMLDCDLLVIDEIKSLDSIYMEEFAIGAVQDLMLPETSGKRLGLHNPESYFNCGVLLVDTEKWKTKTPLLKMPSVAAEYSQRICYGDQDLLNLIFQKSYFALDFKYNHMLMVSLDGNIPNRRLQGQKPSILHFPGQIKPWHEYAPSNLQATYLRYASICNWIGMGILTPESLEETRLAAKVSRNLGNAQLHEKYITKLNFS